MPPCGCAVARHRPVPPGRRRTPTSPVGDVVGSSPVGVGNDPAPREMKSPWSTRFRLSRWPHWAHVCEVYAGSTKTRGTPARLALQTMKSASWANAQEQSETLPHCLKGVGGATRLAEPYPVADALEFFERQAASGAFSLGHDRLGDDVVGIRGVPCFLAGTGFEPPLGALGALLLERGTQGRLSLAVPAKAPPGGEVAGGGRDVRRPYRRSDTSRRGEGFALPGRDPRRGGQARPTSS